MRVKLADCHRLRPSHFGQECQATIDSVEQFVPAASPPISTQEFRGDRLFQHVDHATTSLPGAGAGTG